MSRVFVVWGESSRVSRARLLSQRIKLLLEEERKNIISALEWWEKPNPWPQKGDGGWDGEFSSVAQSCPTFCDPMNRSTPGLPVHHQLPESTQTHVHGVGDAIQLSHPVFPFSSCPQSFPASGSFQMTQLFASGGQRIGISASTSGATQKR